MRIKENFELREVCGESVIVACGIENIDFSKIISLNESAAYLWKHLVGTDFTEQTVQQLLAQEYDVPEETALTDGREMLRSWAEFGLLQ